MQDLEMVELARRDIVYNGSPSNRDKLKRVIDYSEIKLSSYIIAGKGPVDYKRVRKYIIKTDRSKNKKLDTKENFIREKAFQMRTRRTFSEARLWRELNRYQLLGLKFKTQVKIGDFICDFVCPELKLVIEVDGEQHEKDRKTIKQDRKKTVYLNSLGYKVIRFKNYQINYHLNQSLAHLWDICANQLTQNSTIEDDSHINIQINKGNPYYNKIDRFRLCELVKLTGIPKSTIQYYRRKGLLYNKHEYSDRSKIPSHLIQFYTSEHLEKLRHVHSLRESEQVPTRQIFYTFRCIEEAVIKGKSIENLSIQDQQNWCTKTKESFYIPPKKRVLLKHGEPPQLYPSATRPRQHVFAENNPYNNTQQGEEYKHHLNQLFAQQLAAQAIAQQQQSLKTPRARSPLGSDFERLMQMTYENPAFLMARYLAI
jgi:very-short-patch-repair endonuclease